MILLTNGDSWTQGDSPAQDLNWEAKPNLDWYNIMPNFGEPTIPCDDRITYKSLNCEDPVAIKELLDLIIDFSVEYHKTKFTRQEFLNAHLEDLKKLWPKTQEESVK